MTVLFAQEVQTRQLDVKTEVEDINLKPVDDERLTLDKTQLKPEVKLFEPDFKDAYLNQNQFNYQKVIQEKSAWQDFKSWIYLQWQKFLNWLLPDPNKSSFWDILGTALKILAIVVVVAIIIWLYIKYNPGQRFVSEANSPDLKWTEDDYLIKNQNLHQLIEEAIKQDNYRLATRYLFLQTLKQLKDKHLIEYETEKTNASYMKELSASSWATQFNQAVHYYEYVWYGGFTINQDQFNQVETLYSQLLHQLKSKANA